MFWRNSLAPPVLDTAFTTNCTLFANSDTLYPKSPTESGDISAMARVPDDELD
ncbi:MAG: hypothetical protein K0U42_06630 [Actinomycetia bacterium]|nr:hypothetical protein [Actinomycetes bacterium]MCH9738416.1 hypothetical protein [Actinomycetes bacterium]